MRGIAANMSGSALLLGLERRRRCAAAAVMVAVSATLAAGGPAHADDQDVTDGPTFTEEVAGGQTLDEKVTITVETYTLSGDKISTETYDADGQVVDAPPSFRPTARVAASASFIEEARAADTSSGGELAGLGSGSGGTSSASGCRKVTVNNEKETTLGWTAYWFHTWTQWCWNRSAKTISSVSTSWYISDVDQNFYWRGIVQTTTGFYSWKSGAPKSGYSHYRQGRFENCVLKYGCIGNYYPANVLKSHSDGTYTWTTSG